MNKILLFGTVIFSILAFCSHKAFAQLREENKQPAAAAPKILIAYKSNSGNTKDLSEAIHEKIGVHIFEIITEGIYPEAYRPMTQQAKKEIQDGYRPKLTTSVADISQYDIVFLGSANWWGTISPQVSSFLAAFYLSGKTVIPFVTHGGGGVQNTVTDMTAQCNGCRISDNGWVGYGSRTMGISGWLKDLGLIK